MTEKIEFTVVGESKIHCTGCETRINFALQRMPGVQKVEANAQTQQVVIRVDSSQITPEQIQTRLKDIGFEVERVRA